MEQKRDDLLRTYRKRQTAKQDRVALARIADAEFMASMGVNEVEAARRIGVKPMTLYEMLRRRGRVDVWKKLTGYRAPVELNDWERASNRG